MMTFPRQYHNMAVWPNLLLLQAKDVLNGRPDTYTHWMAAPISGATTAIMWGVAVVLNKLPPASCLTCKKNVSLYLDYIFLPREVKAGSTIKVLQGQSIYQPQLINRQLLTQQSDLSTIVDELPIQPGLNRVANRSSICSKLLARQTRPIL